MSELDLITPEECAERLGYSERYFKETVSKMHGFPPKIGKKYNWPDVVRFMASRAA